MKTTIRFYCVIQAKSYLLLLRMSNKHCDYQYNSNNILLDEGTTRATQPALTRRLFPLVVGANLSWCIETSDDVRVNKRHMCI